MSQVLGINMRKVMTGIYIANATKPYSSVEFSYLDSKGKLYSGHSKNGITEHLHSLAQPI